MSYEELLSRPEWQEKRTIILERDNNECRRCGVNHNNAFRTERFKVSYSDLKKHFNIQFINDTNFNIGLVKFFNSNNSLLFKTPLKESDLLPNMNFLFIINFTDRNKITYPFNGSTEENFNNNLFLTENINLLLNDQIKNRLDSIDKEGFFFIKQEEEQEYTKHRNNLHVHHKCYRQNKKIWEQDDSEYLTLCNICHLIVHNNQSIPYYNLKGIKFKDLIPCSRCGGRRYLDCYRHFQNGICFKCNGEGLEVI